MKYDIPELRELGAEANTSKINRICWKYLTPPMKFCNEVLFDKRSSNRSVLTHEVATSLNSLTDKTVLLNRKLNQLLKCKHHSDGCYLNLRGILDNRAHGLIAKNKKWCPICYSERKSAHNTVYDDLYWSLDMHSVCFFHGVLLHQQCPTCRAAQPYINNSFEPGHCNSCGYFLGKAKPRTASQDLLSTQSRTLGLTYIASFNGFNPSFGQFERNIRALFDLYPSLTYGHLSSLMGGGKELIRDWLRKKQKPTLENLILISNSLGLYGPHQLFYNQRAFLSKIEIGGQIALNFNQRSIYKTIGARKEILAAFSDIFEGREVPISRDAFAKRFDIGVNFLKYNYPDQCLQLTNMLSLWNINQKKIRDSNLSIQLDRALSTCKSKGLEWVPENILKFVDLELMTGLSNERRIIAIKRAIENFPKKRSKRDIFK